MPLPIWKVAPNEIYLHRESTDLRRRFTVAILSEGFLDEDMPQFRKLAREIKDILMKRQPFRYLKEHLVIVQVDCRSEASARRLTRNAPRPYRDATPFDAEFEGGKLIGKAQAVWDV